MSKIGNDTKTVFWFVIMIVLATKWELSLLFKFKSKPLELFRLEETEIHLATRLGLGINRVESSPGSNIF